LTVLDFAGYEGRTFGQIPVSVDRRVVLDALRSALPDDAIEFDRECTGAAHQADREQVQFADGDAVPTDLVVGADGLKSAVRRSMFPEMAHRPSGWYAYRGIAGESFAPHRRPEAWQVWGPRTRVSLAAIDGGRVGWTAVVDETLGSRSEPAQVLHALSERCDGWPEPVRTLFARTEVGSVQVDSLTDFAPLDRWHGEGIALAGDAAHAGLPGLWQGVGLAMADAYTIGERLRGVDSIPGALTAYEADRKPIGDWATQRSRQLLRASTLERPPGRQLRNWLLRATPEWTTHRARRRMATVA
jgi:2-polyprenyl-6-methoxyphenol hydroxylase-like FAD-dependent oxidoreductase